MTPAFSFFIALRRVFRLTDPSDCVMSDPNEIEIIIDACVFSDKQKTSRPILPAGSDESGGARRDPFRSYRAAGLRPG